jgi:exodeoxyribonuclease VII small subunit
MSKKAFSYNESLKELEQIVRKIESGDCDLDELSTHVKRATALLKLCKDKLRETEKDIGDILSKMDSEE